MLSWLDRVHTGSETRKKKEILDVLETGHLFRYGDMSDPSFKHKVYTLEEEFADYMNVGHALATSSGTAALLISLKALGIGEGDEVIVPAYTFVATFSSVIFAGAVPVLAEIDESLCLDPGDIEHRITPKTKAIMPVHMLGNPCDMDAIMDIANRHGLVVIEDSCQACGGAYKGKKLGTIGAIGAYSLNVFKTITAGDGGMVATDDKTLYENAFAVHDQGHTANRAGVQVGSRNIIGLNFRVNELLGAVALAQLRKLSNIVTTLGEKKAKLKALIGEHESYTFRKINDPGECNTLLTVLFREQAKATAVSAELGSKTIDHSGWHVYANMEHIGAYLKSIGRPFGKGAYPKTDDILSRAMNISIGVVDGGLGAGFGINIMSEDDEIKKVADRFHAVL